MLWYTQAGKGRVLSQPMYPQIQRTSHRYETARRNLMRKNLNFRIGVHVSVILFALQSTDLFATNKPATVKQPRTVYCLLYEQSGDPVGKATRVYI